MMILNRRFALQMARTMGAVCCISIFVLAAPFSAIYTALAQPEDATPIAFDTDIDGQLDNLTVSATFSFEGKRGEFVSVELSTTDGNLDPLLTILDRDGTVMMSMDDSVGRGASVESLRIPANGTYYINVARFGGTVGTTRGGFTPSTITCGGEFCQWQRTALQRYRHQYDF